MENFITPMTGFMLVFLSILCLTAYIRIRSITKELVQVRNTLSSMSGILYSLTLALDEHKKDVDNQLIKKDKQILKG
jgi:hypothetical protein